MADSDCIRTVISKFNWMINRFCRNVVKLGFLNRAVSVLLDEITVSFHDVIM